MSRLLQRLRWWWHQPINQVLCWHAWEPFGKRDGPYTPTAQPHLTVHIQRYQCRRCEAFKAHQSITKSTP